MASCEHLWSAEEQMRDLLRMVNEHLKQYDPDEEAYGSLLAVAHHVHEAFRELSYLIDQAEETDDPFEKEVGH